MYIDSFIICRWPPGQRMRASWLPVILPSFGERYLSSALFQTLREDAEKMTFDA